MTDKIRMVVLRMKQNKNLKIASFEGEKEIANNTEEAETCRTVTWLHAGTEQKNRKQKSLIL